MGQAGSVINDNDVITFFDGELTYGKCSFVDICRIKNGSQGERSSVNIILLGLWAT